MPMLVRLQEAHHFNAVNGYQDGGENPVPPRLSIGIVPLVLARNQQRSHD